MLCKEYLEVDKKNTNNPIEKQVNVNQHEKVLKFLKIMGMQIKETMNITLLISVTLEKVKKSCTTS